MEKNTFDFLFFSNNAEKLLIIFKISTNECTQTEPVTRTSYKASLYLASHTSHLISHITFHKYKTTNLYDFKSHFWSDINTLLEAF